jgi:hypothetical protein
VQGRKDGDVYSGCCPFKAGRSSGQLADIAATGLRIHKDTERGDNDTIKLGNKTIKIDGQKCCSS